MFSRKFQRLAEQFSDAIFLDIVGDETSDTRVSPAVLVDKILQYVKNEALHVKALYHSLIHPDSAVCTSFQHHDVV